MGPTRLMYGQTKVAISVDVDEWNLCRWATGSGRSIWQDKATSFQRYYGSKGPIGGLAGQTAVVLHLFHEHSMRASFFVLGEVATHSPGLVRHVSSRGDGIGCHALRRVDMYEFRHAQFTREISEANTFTEDTIGSAARAFRILNALPPVYLIGALEHAGFEYHSSVFPSHRFMGKCGYTKTSFCLHRASRGGA